MDGGGGFYSDDEDFGGQIVYGDAKNLDDLDSQSQDDRDLNAAVHTKFNVAARKRLGLGRRGAHPPGAEHLLGSDELEERLRQQDPRAFKQGLQGILEGLNASEPSEGGAQAAAPPPPARRAVPPPPFPSRRPTALPQSPVAATAPSPARSPGFQLTAGSQWGGTAGGGGGGGAGGGAPRSSANPFGVDVEMIHIYNYHNAAMRRTGPAPRGGGTGRRAGGGRQHRQFAQTQAAAAAAAAAGAGRPGAGLTTPQAPSAPQPGRGDPLMALLSSSGRGGGNGARGGRPPPGSARAPPLRGASRFRQPALGTPGPGAAAGAGAWQAPGAADVIELVEDGERGAAGAPGAAMAPARLLQSFETPGPAPQTGPHDSPALGSGGAGSGPRGSGQDAFLAGLAPPSARPGAGRQRSRMAGGAPNSLQARLKRVLEADEGVAAARQQARASAGASADCGALEATVQDREMEQGVYKVRVILAEGSGDPGPGGSDGPAFFFIPGATARDADLAPGKRMRVSPPWRLIRSHGGSSYFMCSGSVETLG